MLAVVKKPHTEIALSGPGAERILAFLRDHFEIEALAPRENDNELVNLKDTPWWRDNKRRVLSGARLKANFTQRQLAELSGIRQTVISEYERGKRKITQRAAIKLAKALDIEPERLLT